MKNNLPQRISDQVKAAGLKVTRITEGMPVGIPFPNTGEPERYFIHGFQTCEALMIFAINNALRVSVANMGNNNTYAQDITKKSEFYPFTKESAINEADGRIFTSIPNKGWIKETVSRAIDQIDMSKIFGANPLLYFGQQLVEINKAFCTKAPADVVVIGKGISVMTMDLGLNAPGETFGCEWSEAAAQPIIVHPENEDVKMIMVFDGLAIIKASDDEGIYFWIESFPKLKSLTKKEKSSLVSQDPNDPDFYDVWRCFNKRIAELSLNKS